jgi:CheY-like chemotaxis protein
VVDDEAVLLQLLQQVLEDAGHQVLTETESAGALTRIRADEPDLVILDLFSGEVSGFDVIRSLREDRRTEGTRVILCTGATREIDEQRAWLDEMKVPVLEKPFDLDDLVNLVDGQISIDGR